MIYRDDEILKNLEPCPICNKREMLYFTRAESATYRRWSVGCGLCQIDTYPQRNRADATSRWNKLPRKEN